MFWLKSDLIHLKRTFICINYQFLFKKEFLSLHFKNSIFPFWSIYVKIFYQKLFFPPLIITKLLFCDLLKIFYVLNKSSFCSFDSWIFHRSKFIPESSEIVCLTFDISHSDEEKMAYISLSTRYAMLSILLYWLVYNMPPLRSRHSCLMGGFPFYFDDGGACGVQWTTAESCV